MAHTTAPILALAGGAGSGKTTLAAELQRSVPGSAVIHLDRCFHDDSAHAPVVPAINGRGVVVNYSDPGALDPDRVQAALARHRHATLLVVEGTFALLPRIRATAAWTCFVDAPADVRLARKTLRKIEDRANPEISLRGYLAHGRDAHERHVAPIRAFADLVLDGTRPVTDLSRMLLALMRLPVPLCTAAAGPPGGHDASRPLTSAGEN